MPAVGKEKRRQGFPAGEKLKLNTNEHAVKGTSYIACSCGGFVSVIDCCFELFLLSIFLFFRVFQLIYP